jgi:hypothetical protein
MIDFRKNVTTSCFRCGCLRVIFWCGCSECRCFRIGIRLLIVVFGVWVVTTFHLSLMMIIM